MQKFFYKRSPVWDYILMLVGTALIAVSIQCVYDPVSMVTGGFTGLAIIIKDVTGYLIPGGIPLWLTNIVLNIPIFLYSYIRFGKNYIGKTGFATILLSVWLYLIPVIDMSGDDYMLAALFGGAFTGIGMALVLKAGATTGGDHPVTHAALYGGSGDAGTGCSHCDSRLICIWFKTYTLCSCFYFCVDKNIRCLSGGL